MVTKLEVKKKRTFFYYIVHLIIGPILVILLLIGGLYLLLQKNITEDISTIMVKSIPISDSGNFEGKFVSHSGKIGINEAIGDKLFLIKGKYVYLERIVEMYSWNEDNSKIRNYTKNWEENPKDSSLFKIPEKYVNPPKIIDSLHDSVMEANIGDYSFDLLYLELPEPKILELRKEILVPSINLSIKKSLKEEAKDEIMRESLINGKELTKKEIVTAIIIRVNAKRSKMRELEMLSIKERDEQKKLDIINRGKHAYIQEGNYLYVGSGRPSDPAIGDLRISYKVIHENTYSTIIGQVEGKKIVKYSYNNELNIYKLFGSSREEAIGKLSPESTFIKGAVKGGGLFMIISGMILLYFVLRSKKNIKNNRFKVSTQKVPPSNTIIEKKGINNNSYIGNENIIEPQSSGHTTEIMDTVEINKLLKNKADNVSEYINIKTKNGERKVNNISKAADEGIIRSGNQIEKINNKNIDEEDILRLLNKDN